MARLTDTIALLRHAIEGLLHTCTLVRMYTRAAFETLCNKSLLQEHAGYGLTNLRSGM